jgi:hypothetical protein
VCFKKKPVIPHPEEPPNYNQTIENTSVRGILTDWTIAYDIPLEFHPYWFTAIDINVTVGIFYPAGTWEDSDGKRHLDIRPEYLNPGVLAHEFAHCSYGLLTTVQKLEFAAIYTVLKHTDKMIKYLYSINTYGLSNDIEAHAEIYRYGVVPGPLKKFYPRLLQPE